MRNVTYVKCHVGALPKCVWTKSFYSRLNMQKHDSENFGPTFIPVCHPTNIYTYILIKSCLFCIKAQQIKSPCNSALIPYIHHVIISCLCQCSQTMTFCSSCYIVRRQKVLRATEATINVLATK